MELLDKLSPSQIEEGLKAGRYPPILALTSLDLKNKMRKQFEQQQIMQQQPPQSTIAEQVMQEAQMAQAAPGVEGLPSNLPQEYAGGGIVAFDEGGEVERYSPGGSTNPPLSALFQSILGIPPTEEQYEEDRIKKERERIEDALRLERLREEQKPKAGIDAFVGALSSPTANMSAAEMAIPGMGGYEPPVATPRKTISDTEAQQIVARMQELGMPVGRFTYEDIKAGRIQMPTVPSVGETAAPAAAPTGKRPAAGPGAGGPGAAPAGFGGLFPKKPVLGSEETEAEKRFDAAQKQEAARRTTYEEERKKVEGSVPGRAFDLLDKQLQEEALQAGATKEQAKYMALIEAGLAMMSGTSQNALENIGKGALVGVNSYKSALKDIEKAQKEHRRALASIDQARRAEALGDRDRQLSFMEKAYNAETESARARVDGIMKARGVDRATALKIYEIDYGGARTQIQAAASMARGQGRGSGLTQAQMANITDQAIKSIGDRAMFDLAAAKKLGGKDATPPTSGTIRDKIDKMYQDEVKKRVRERLQFISGYATEEDDPNAGYERMSG